MNKLKLVLLITTLFLLIFFLISPPARALWETLELSWWSVDSGGGQSNGADYSLLGVAGQPDAGVIYEGEYSLVGGFLSGAVVPPPPRSDLFIPLVVK